MSKKDNNIRESCEKTCTKKLRYDILFKRGKVRMDKLQNMR